MSQQQAGHAHLSVHMSPTDKTEGVRVCKRVPMHHRCSCQGSHAAETSTTQSGCHHMSAPSTQALQHCSSLLPEPTAVLQRVLQAVQSRRPSCMLCCSLSQISVGSSSQEPQDMQHSRDPS